MSYRKVYLTDDEDGEEADQNQNEGSSKTSLKQQDSENQHSSDDNYHYSEDHESYSEDNEHEDRTSRDKEGE